MAIAYIRRKIRMIESNAKCRYIKNWPVKGLRHVFYLSEAPLSYDPLFLPSSPGVGVPHLGYRSLSHILSSHLPSSPGVGDEVG